MDNGALPGADGWGQSLELLDSMALALGESIELNIDECRPWVVSGLSLCLDSHK
jgi:hypothetical protein